MRLWEHDAVHKSFVAMMDSLPDRPDGGADIWAGGYDYILCRTEEQAIELAELIGYDYYGPCPSYDALEYGYFDPEADKEDEEESGKNGKDSLRSAFACNRPGSQRYLPDAF